MNAIEGAKRYAAKMIVEGFQCDVLGKAHHYPLSETDQINMLSVSVLANVALVNGDDFVGRLQCIDEDGTVDYKDHSLAQVLAVVKTANQHKRNCLLYMQKNLIPKIKKGEIPVDLKPVM